MLLSIPTFGLVYAVFILVFIALAFKYLLLERRSSINKPYAWEETVEQKKLSNRLLQIERTYQDKIRFYTFWFQIERLKKLKIEGDFAELGVFRGESAEFISEMDSSRTLHLFDTFSGFEQQDLDKENERISEQYSTSNFSNVTLQQVKERLKNQSNIVYYVGYFPDTTLGLEDKKYAFVHIDADLYQPTLAALNYFYPRLSANGVIIIHDYNHIWNGVTKAVNEFSATIPESLIEIPDWQGSVMIVKQKQLKS